jgi:hypothetical protein
MGFDTVGEYAAADEAGRTWLTGFRKTVSSTATTTNNWLDYSYFSGSPGANFYASTPSEAAEVDATRGIRVPSVPSSEQYLKNLMLMTAASSATSTTNGLQKIALVDLLLYYPFIDTDAVGEQQDLVNTVTIPRYGSGQVIAVAQSASSALGQFTMTYTNQDGTGGRVSQNHFTPIVAGGGQVVNATGAGASFNPYMYLQAGDSGVKSIESVTFTAAGGGLMALVIVKPLLFTPLTQECRRTTSGNLESYGAAMEFSSVIQGAAPARIYDGAVLGLFGQGFSGSLASSIVSGLIETVWN